MRYFNYKFKTKNTPKLLYCNSFPVIYKLCGKMFIYIVLKLYNTNMFLQLNIQEAEFEPKSYNQIFPEA